MDRLPPDKRDELAAQIVAETQRIAQEEHGLALSFASVIDALIAGAGMAALLATRHPHRFAAVAMHSGVAPGAAKSTATAISAMHGHRAPSIPTTAVGKAIGAAAQGTTLPPLLVLHGDADHVVASSNAHSAAMVWASATAARPSAERLVRRGQRHPMRVTDFKRGRQICVTLCQIEKLGHAWSGGIKSVAYSDPAGPDATRLVWAFVQKQFAFAARATVRAAARASR